MRTILIAVIVTWLAACAPTPTPLPPFIPTDAPPTATPGNAQPVRYAFVGLSQEAVSDLAQIEDVAQVEWLAAAPDAALVGARFDVVAAYGIRPNWVQSAVFPHVSLLINPATAPLNQPELAALTRRAVDPLALLEPLGIPGAQVASANAMTVRDFRLELANAGWPDGFNVELAYTSVPGAAGVIERLNAAGIQPSGTLASTEEIRAKVSMDRLHMALITWTTAEERDTWVSLVGPENVIDLYTLPVSYLVADGLNLSFTPSGWPLPESENTPSD